VGPDRVLHGGNEDIRHRDDGEPLAEELGHHHRGLGWSDHRHPDGLPRFLEVKLAVARAREGGVEPVGFCLPDSLKNLDGYEGAVAVHERRESLPTLSVRALTTNFVVGRARLCANSTMFFKMKSLSSLGVLPICRTESFAKESSYPQTQLPLMDRGNGTT
jgi:hypothetical protein